MSSLKCAWCKGVGGFCMCMKLGSGSAHLHSECTRVLLGLCVSLCVRAGWWSGGIRGVSARPGFLRTQGVVRA